MNDKIIMNNKRMVGRRRSMRLFAKRKGLSLSDRGLCPVIRHGMP